MNLTQRITTSRKLRPCRWSWGYSFVPVQRFAVYISRLQSSGIIESSQQYQIDNASKRTHASNSAMSFPCLDAIETKNRLLKAHSLSSGPEPSYTSGETQIYTCQQSLLLDWGGNLPEFTIAYETWGEVNNDQSNVILLHTGLSASSHAHSTEKNSQLGWWENFIGSGKCLDTDKYFVICSNVLGGCHGSTGPGSIDPSDGQRYATRFPILTIQDIVRAQFRLLDHLGVKRLFASVGSSMGGMQSLAAGVLFPERIERIVSISACTRSQPYSIAIRHTQRQVLMMDPNWNRGFYYGSVPPHVGMKLAREIATITYRSGPEWEQRFGRMRADPQKPPALCPDFLIETYLDHSGEKFCLDYDANSLLYLSKAMDLFDLGGASYAQKLVIENKCYEQKKFGLELPKSSYQEHLESSMDKNSVLLNSRTRTPPLDVVRALESLKEHNILVIGVESDILFPSWQQKEIVEALKLAGNTKVIYCELTEDVCPFGHDTFLLDVKNIGGNIQRFLG
ncbi:Serine O-succinyltransferase [Erysiphe necator]|nr:Serine O-succinyltransferase [Erysiphe necator]